MFFQWTNAKQRFLDRLFLAILMQHLINVVLVEISVIKFFMCFDVFLKNLIPISSHPLKWSHVVELMRVCPRWSWLCWQQHQPMSRTVQSKTNRGHFPPKCLLSTLQKYHLCTVHRLNLLACKLVLEVKISVNLLVYRSCPSHLEKLFHLQPNVT